MTRIRGSLKIISPVEITGVDEAPVQVSETSAKTQYWSCTGCNFVARQPDVNDIIYTPSFGKVAASVDDIIFFAPVFLPHTATILAVEVFGNAGASAENWDLWRRDLATNLTVQLATANINTEDTSIINPIIDNNLYSYHIDTDSLDTGDEIWGARITYTI